MHCTTATAIADLISLEAISSGLLHGLWLGGRMAEDVRAQVVARNRAVGNIFGGETVFRRDYCPLRYTLLA